MAGSSGNVVVWEWCDDTGDWQPYSSHVSNYIEQHHTTSANTAVSANVALGQADPASHIYEVDINTMTQTRRDTRRQRPVRRSIYPPTSLLASGVVWEWLADYTWQPYTRHAAKILEKAHTKQKPSVDLTPCRMPYIVDLGTMIQTNKRSNFTRQVRRVQSMAPYAREGGVAGSGSHGATAVPPPAVPPPAVMPPAVMPPAVPNTMPAMLPAMPLTVLPQIPPAHTQPVPPQPGLVQPPAHGLQGFLQRALPSSLLRNFLAHRQKHHGHSTNVVTSLSNVPNTSVSAPGTSASSSQTAALNLSVPSTSSGRRAGSPSHLPKPKRHKSLEQLNSDPQHVIDAFTSPFTKPDKEECPICCEEMTTPSGYDSNDSVILQLEKCKHHYHRACILSMYMSGTKDGSLQCPTCKCIHGMKLGICPPGTVDVQKISTSLPGYDDCGALLITYTIHSGTQGADDPNPGESFTARGFPRRAYLPDNERGNKVCKLLLEAWRRRLTFTIGNSVTTGEPSTVVWNEIHHKTEIQDHYGHGYPDPNYLDNVTKELESQGVTEQCL